MPPGLSRFSEMLLIGFVILCLSVSASKADNTTATTVVAPVTTASTTTASSLSELECSCKGLSCTCCQQFKIPIVSAKKNLCVQFTLKLIPLSIVVNVQFDNSTIFTTTIDPKNPPKYCLPFVIQTVNACLQLHDIKLLDLTSVQVCSTFYFDYQTSRVIEEELPCLKLSATSGISIIK